MPLNLNISSLPMSNCANYGWVLSSSWLIKLHIIDLLLYKIENNGNVECNFYCRYCSDVKISIPEWFGSAVDLQVWWLIVKSLSAQFSQSTQLTHSSCIQHLSNDELGSVEQITAAVVISPGKITSTQTGQTGASRE